MTSNPKILPITTIQPTFLDVVQEVSAGLIPFEDIWISCYHSGNPSVHTKAQVILDEVDRDKVIFNVREGDNVQVTTVNNDDGSYYEIMNNAMGVRSRVVTSRQEYRDQEKANTQKPDRITAFDVSPDGKQYATGYLDGSIHLQPTSPFPVRSTSHKSVQPPAQIYPPKHTKQISRNSHKSTITSLKYFPSSRVLLSSSSDFTLGIFPADPLDSPDPKNPPTRINPARVLKGHTRGVTDTAIRGRGRTVLSGSRDGTLKLWDVSQGEIVQSHSSTSSTSLNRIVLPKSQSEEEDDENTVYTAHSDGSLGKVDIRQEDGSIMKLFGETNAGEIVSLALSQDTHTLASGTSRGLVHLFDTRNFAQPVSSWKRNEGSVEGLTFCANGDLVLGAEDGLAYIADIKSSDVKVKGELVVGDCDAVRALKIRQGKELWSASDDGIVRMYNL